MATLVLFSKRFKDRSTDELIELAHACGVAGYDLCVRDGHQVTPQNVGRRLPEVVGALRQNGLKVPMATGGQDFLDPRHPSVGPILRAVAQCGIPRIKLGYFIFDASKGPYLAHVERVRRQFARWERLGREYGVRICYHTHSGPCMGVNGAALAHLLVGFDPAWLGAYIDPAHLVVDGEEFPYALAMLRSHLAVVAFKDVLLVRKVAHGHGSRTVRWVQAGQGMVDWTTVFTELQRVGFDGPCSIHCEFQVPASRESAAVRREAAFFRRAIRHDPT
jgi:sugar phosphate isomerase/epimerase